MDKRDRALLFRHRLAEALDARGLSRSALARAVGIDRSTVTQLLSEGGVRLPNAQVVAECAAALGVSGDWLLGLSDLREPASDLLAASMQVADAPRAPIDEQIWTWQDEAAGYKIRHVPATMPDMLKTEAMIEWEYAPHLGRSAEQAIRAGHERLGWMRRSMTDYEIAMPLHEVAALATSTGYYASLPAATRRGQIAHMATLSRQLYPSLRVTLFDARRLWSAPLTIFGPLVGVIYLGEQYLAFRDRDRVAMLTRQFDRLVREASVTARDWPAHLEALGSGG